MTAERRFGREPREVLSMPLVQSRSRTKWTIKRVFEPNLTVYWRRNHYTYDPHVVVAECTAASIADPRVAPESLGFARMPATAQVRRYV
jgi:hypothetical protein